MKGSHFRRLITIALLTAALTFGAFEVALHQRVQKELGMPSHVTPPAETIQALHGFKVRLIHEASLAEGSWISMARDPQGRLIISPETGQLLRVTLAGGQLEQPRPLDSLRRASGARISGRGVVERPGAGRNECQRRVDGVAGLGAMRRSRDAK